MLSCHRMQLEESVSGPMNSEATEEISIILFVYQAILRTCLYHTTKNNNF